MLRRPESIILICPARKFNWKIPWNQSTSGEQDMWWINKQSLFTIKNRIWGTMVIEFRQLIAILAYLPPAMIVLFFTSTVKMQDLNFLLRAKQTLVFPHYIHQSNIMKMLRLLHIHDTFDFSDTNQTITSYNCIISKTCCPKIESHFYRIE